VESIRVVLLRGVDTPDIDDYERRERMNQEMTRIMEALILIYGSDLQAATITVLLKDGDTAVRFITSTLPQKENNNG
jgi:hypothetical protein